LSACQERGAFPLWDAELEVDNPFLKRLFKADSELALMHSLHGRRNIAALTIAPAGTVSVLTKTSSGIECVFLVGYIRRRKINPNAVNVRVDFIDENGDSWEEYFVFHHHFATWLSVNGYNVDEVSKMNNEDLAKIVEKSPYNKALSNDVDWLEKVRMQGRIQKWIDHSISVTVNLPNNVDTALVGEVYKEAWLAGCKGCTIYRDGSRTGVLIERKDEAEKKLYGENLVDGFLHAAKRPKDVQADVQRFTNKGEKWIGIIGLYDGVPGKLKGNQRPYEAFTGIAGDMEIPSYVETGIVRKSKVKVEDGNKTSKYDFVYTDKAGDEVVVEWINRTFNKEYWNYAKMVSGVLRHRMPLPYVVDLISSLNLDDEVLTTWKAGVARMVKRYIPDGTAASDKNCKECGSDSVVYQEGCLSCKSCGSSKCG
jgi:ribonucleoside-diphosphate reductase alpha chain